MRVWDYPNNGRGESSEYCTWVWRRAVKAGDLVSFSEKEHQVKYQSAVA
jgi:hypothetical protein